MSTPWNSLYCPSEDAERISRTLQESLLTLGYEPYNPFGMFPGKSYQQTVKLFTAPIVNGWVRVLGVPDAGQLADLSQSVLCLFLQLDGQVGLVTTYMNGSLVDPVALTPYLKSSCTPEALTRVLAGDDSGALSSPKPVGLPFDALPDDVQALVGGVDKGAAEKMFTRLSGQLMKKVGGQSDAARALISGEGAPDWESSGGHKIRVLMDCLTVPAHWREPDFDTLSQAYALHERRRRSPNARLYPGDEGVMTRVPNALDYKPIYGGRNP